VNSAPRCRLCGLPISVGDDTVVNEAGAMHAGCAATRPDDEGVVAAVRQLFVLAACRFAGTHPDAPVAEHIGAGRYRMRSAFRVASGRLGALGMVVAAIVVPLIGPGPDPNVGERVAACIIFLAGAGVWLRVTRGRIEWSSDGVDVYTTLHVTHVEWREIEQITLDYVGLRLHLHDGRVVTALDGKSNWSRVARVRTSADERLSELDRAWNSTRQA